MPQTGQKYQVVRVIDGEGHLAGSVNYPILTTTNELANYQVVEVDDSSPAYYGFEDKDGKWYIMKENSDSYRYVKGNSGFSTNWSNRASLSYDYPSNAF